MSWLVDLLGVYGRVLRRAVELTLKHWWLGPVAIGYQVLVLALMAALGPFGMVGGFIVTIGMAALMSSWMVLVGNVVRNGRVTFADVPGSFAVYLLDVVTFFFLLWVLNTIAGIAFQDLVFAAIVFEFASFVFLNAVPEQIYLGGNAGTAVFIESYRFIGTYWIEWIPMTVALAVMVLVAASVPFPPLALALGGIGFALMSIARGLLFLELTTSSRRAREFARRAAG